MLTGTCVHTGITAILNFHWSVFKFSLVFNENPEGNSYYLHKAVLEYNQVTLTQIQITKNSYPRIMDTFNPEPITKKIHLTVVDKFCGCNWAKKPLKSIRTHTYLQDCD
jgi:hypothetical protein